MTYKELKTSIENQKKLLDCLNCNNKGLNVQIDTVRTEMSSILEISFAKIGYTVSINHSSTVVDISYCSQDTFADVLNSIYDQLLYIRDKYMVKSRDYMWYEMMIDSIRELAQKIIRRQLIDIIHIPLAQGERKKQKSGHNYALK